MKRFLCLGLLLWAGIAWPAEIDLPGLHPDLIFDFASPLARNAEIVRRLLNPADFQLFQRRSSGQLAEFSVDLAQERFLLYLPPSQPPQGYWLMVFVPPWEDAELPPGWGGVMDRHGMIFVSPAHAGNRQNVIDRRLPLALLAAENVRRRFPIDPDHIIVAGFSGGAKVALKLALAYPDLFTGALLNAGSNRFGSAELLRPPEDLWRRFQANSHLVFFSGEYDSINVTLDQQALQSLSDQCVLGLASITIPWRGHEVANGNFLERAIALLQAPPLKNDDCRR